MIQSKLWLSEVALVDSLARIGEWASFGSCSEPTDVRHKSPMSWAVDRRTQVEASSRAESEDIVSLADSVSYTANMPVAASMKQKQSEHTTEKKDAAKALDSLLLMDEVWYATTQRRRRHAPCSFHN